MGRAREVGGSRRWRARLLVSLGTLLALLLGAEGFFRLRPGAQPEPGGEGFVVPDTELLWRLRPSARGPFATNELGFRDGPHDDAADLTILLLGDSVAWGDGVTDRRACFPALVEEGLAAGGSGRTVELINAAVPGWATFQELAYLDLHGLALEPDLVLLQVCLNDVTERYRVLAQYGGADRFLGIDTRALVPGLHGWLLRHSAAYRVLGRELTRRARDREAYSVKKLCRADWGDELEQAWRRFEEELVGLVEVARRANVPIAVVATPYRFQLDDPGGTGGPQELMARLLAERGVPFLDLLPHLADVGGEAFRDPSHLSRRGHLEAARVLLPWLRGVL